MYNIWPGDDPMASNRKLVTVVVLILFVITLLIQISGIFIIPENAGREYLLDKIFLYGSIIIFYLSAAYLFSKLVKIILWKSEFKKKIRSDLIGKLEDLIVTIIYFTSIGFIIIEIRAVEVTFYVVIIYLILLALAIYLRPYLIRLSKTGFIQSVRPFKIGDWIGLHNNSGDLSFIGKVTGFDIRSVKLISENNTMLIVPNAQLNLYVVENYSILGKEIRFSLDISLSSGIKTDQAKRILTAASKDALCEAMVVYNHDPEVLLTNFPKEINDYKINFLYPPWEVLTPEEMKDKILVKVEEHLEYAGISISNKERSNNILKHITLFDRLSESDLNKLLKSAKITHHKRGEEIIKQSDDGDSMFVLKEGLLNVFIGTDQNERIKVGTLTPGKFFGEMSLFTGQKRQATVVADTESLTLEISKEEIKNILKNKPELVNDFGELIAEREAINQKMLDQFNHRKESFVKKMVESIRLFFNIG